MKLTKEILKRIIKEELEEALKFKGDNRTMDQVRFDTNLALTPPSDIESEEEPQVDQSQGTVFDSIVQRNIEAGMSPEQAYYAAAAERPDLAYGRY